MGWSRSRGEGRTRGERANDAVGKGRALMRTRQQLRRPMVTNGAVDGCTAVGVAKTEVLDAVVRPVGDEEAEPIRRDLQAVRVVHLAGAVAPGA